MRLSCLGDGHTYTHTYTHTHWQLADHVWGRWVGRKDQLGHKIMNALTFKHLMCRNNDELVTRQKYLKRKIMRRLLGLLLAHSLAFAVTIMAKNSLCGQFALNLVDCRTEFGAIRALCLVCMCVCEQQHAWNFRLKKAQSVRKHFVFKLKQQVLEASPTSLNTQQLYSIFRSGLGNCC